MKKRYQLRTELHGDLLEVRILNRGSGIFKRTCPVNNQKLITELGNILKYKFDIEFTETKRKKFVDDIEWFS